MNTFFDYIQPTIVRTTDDEAIPENLRNRFFVNFNVFGIDYFLEHYVLTENENGTPYFLLKEDSWGIELEEYFEDTDVLDAPRIYIDITDKFVNDDGNLFQSFVRQAVAQNSIWAVGIENFEAGKDYYLNYTLYNFLANTNQITTANFAARLPNFLDASANLQSQYWDDLSDEVYKDYKNLPYYRWMNQLLENDYSKDELDNFYANFCKIILKYTKITDETRATSTNQIYDLVLNYYANYQSDDISTAINLVLGSMYSTTTSSTCSCSTSSDTTTSSASCATLYAEAMPLYLQQMLADSEFYNDWFTIQVTSTNETIPNEALIENLRTYINEFIDLGYTLDFTSTNTSNCECPSVSSNASDCNYNILRNYLLVLDYVYNDEVSSNKNKIKVFGTQMGKLLPNLQF